MEHIHGSYESTNRFRINPFSRAIINESEIDIAIAQYDHNSERFIFELPKVVEEHDMTQCSAIRIHYINAGSNGKANKGAFEVSDISVSEEDADTVTFSWLLSRNTTSLDGVLSFAIQFICTTDGEVDYSWSTLPYKSIKIPETYDNSDEVIIEDYSDILEQWKEELFGNFDKSMEDYYTKTEVDEKMSDKADEYAGMQRISLVDVSTLNRELIDGEFITEDSLKLSSKGTLTVDFQGYAHFRMIVSSTANNLLIDSVSVDANPYLDDDFVLEYYGFVNENIQIVCGSGCEHTVDFYGIPNVISKTEFDNKLAKKADKTSGLRIVPVLRKDVTVNRELTAGEGIRTNAITLMSPAILSIKYHGYIRINVACSEFHNYTHIMCIDGVKVSSISAIDSLGLPLTYSGYVSDTIEVITENPSGVSDHGYILTFELHGIPDAIPESKIDEKIEINALKASASGEIVRVDDVSAMPHKAVATITSKNLAIKKNTQTTVTTEGITYTANDDGTVTANGTATGTAYFLMLGSTDYTSQIPIKKGRYTIGMAPAQGCRISVGVRNNAYENRILYYSTHVNSITFDITTDTARFDMILCVDSGYNVNNVIFEPLLVEGDTATEYEPYIDPTSVTVTRCGKNLIPVSAKTSTGNGITFTVNDDGSVTCNGTATKNAVINLTENYRLPLGTYILRGCPSTGSDTTYRLQTNKVIDGAVTTGCVDIGLSTGSKLNITQECQVYTYIVVLAGTTVSNVTFYPQLRMSSDADTTYEPYNGATYTPASDGTVEIDSIAPTMTVLTDKSGVNIDLEYQQDHNMAMDDVREDIRALDDSVANILVDIGDFEAALDNIIAMQNTLMGGDGT